MFLSSIKESSRFFEKKRRKKLLVRWCRNVATPVAKVKKSLFASFSSEKEVLPSSAAETHLVLIPSYNTGAKLFETVADALRYWRSVWVVIDGSTDGTGEALADAAGREQRLRVIQRRRNGGKGAAVLDGLRAAYLEGFTHVLIMDADGQHPAASIPKFMRLSCVHPQAMILGSPVFDRTAPRIRIMGRKLSNALTRLETLCGIGDSLFGFRVYPLAALMTIMESTRAMRRFDFDVEAVVRLSWCGVAAINQPAPVRYFRVWEGGVSHFRYGRDNLLLAAMHLRLIALSLGRLPLLAARRFRPSRH
jgi:glycosyltransferase involved in cell wall biosynthesis